MYSLFQIERTYLTHITKIYSGKLYGPMSSAVPAQKLCKFTNLKQINFSKVFAMLSSESGKGVDIYEKL